MLKPYVYKGKLLKIIDGDTLDCMLDLGFKCYREIRCRLIGIDAPETNTIVGKAAKEYLEKLIPLGSDILIESKKDDRYGRALIILYFNNIDINSLILKKDYAISSEK